MDSIVNKLLKKQTEARYQSAHDVQTDLRNLLHDLKSGGLFPSVQGRLILVVLPFENMSQDAAQEYSSDGLTEEMGRHLWNKRTEEGMRKSILQYEEAIRKNPEYAMAYVGLADSYVMLACRGMAAAKETFLKAKVAARKALDLDGDLPDAHGSLAHVRLHNWDGND